MEGEGPITFVFYLAILYISYTLIKVRSLYMLYQNILYNLTLGFAILDQLFLANLFSTPPWHRICHRVLRGYHIPIDNLVGTTNAVSMNEPGLGFLLVH